jgi:Uma2 family endonuclease
MSNLAESLLWSFADYLAYEQRGDIRHEYVAGHIYAMAGASEAHNRIAGNLYFHLRAAARGGTCGVFIADMKVRVEAHDVCYYPDVAVVCDPSDTDAYVKRRPCLLAEVLSPSTQTTDLREKWLAYRVIPGLAYYLVVAADRRRVQVHRRGPDGDWGVALLGPDETLEVRCGDLVANINLDLIYEDVAVPAANEAAGWD